MASNRYQKCVLRKWRTPSIEVQRGFETAVPHQHQPGFLHEHLSGCLQLLSRETHGLPQRTAEQVPRVPTWPAPTAVWRLGRRAVAWHRSSRMGASRQMERLGHVGTGPSSGAALARCDQFLILLKTLVWDGPYPIASVRTGREQ